MSKNAEIKKVVGTPSEDPNYGDLPAEALLEIATEAARMLDREEGAQERNG